VAALPTAHEFHVPLGSDERAVAGELQRMLVDLIDLALIGKQAHWNVEGAQFRSVHHELDELVDAWRTLGDEVAERAVTIGAAPDGQAETVAGSTEIKPLPAGVLGDQAVIDAMATRLADVTARTRKSIERTAGMDPVTEDLLIRVAGSLEKQLWLIRAQRERA
jgi:starvation-inducible DNA-binding protein